MIVTTAEAPVTGFPFVIGTVMIPDASATTEAEYLSDPQAQAERDLRALQPSNGVDFNQTPAEVPQQELSEEQKNMVPQIKNFRTLAPADKQQILSSATTTQKPEGYESRSIRGLSELYPDLTGAMLIPEVGTKTTIKRTVSTSDKPGSEIRESFAEENIKVGEKLYEFNSKSAENIPTAVNAMTKQAPADSKKTFVKLFNENGGIENAVISPTEDPRVYKLFFNGNDKDEYTISDTQANNLSIAQSIPALSGSGVQFLGKEKRKEDEAKTQPGLPVVQPPPVAPQIPEAAGNPFAAKLETIQKTETVAGKKKTVQEVSRVIDTVTRLEQTLAGLAKGEMPETIDYLPRAKKAALQGTDLEGLKKEFNILANLKPAIEWVRKNPNDPKAAQAAEAIRQQLGI